MTISSHLHKQNKTTTRREWTTPFVPHSVPPLDVMHKESKKDLASDYSIKKWMVTVYEEWKEKKKPKVNPFKYSLAVFSIVAAYILVIELISRIDLENTWIEAIVMIALFPVFFFSLSKLGNLAQAGKLPFLLHKEENERHNQSH